MGCKYLSLPEIPTFGITIPICCSIHVYVLSIPFALQWRHNERDGVPNHWRLHCLLNCWFRPKSKKTSKLRVTSLCAGNSRVTSEFPAQRPVTRKMFPFDDVIMEPYACASSLVHDQFPWPETRWKFHFAIKTYWQIDYKTISSRTSRKLCCRGMWK